MVHLGKVVSLSMSTYFCKHDAYFFQRYRVYSDPNKSYDEKLIFTRVLGQKVDFIF